MINIVDKKDCCGCSACVAACPVKCISFIPDNEGFLYPSVDTAKCIGCNLCNKSCPVSQSKSPAAEDGTKEDRDLFTRKCIENMEHKVDSYAVYNCNDEVRKKSTSGGFFSVLAHYILAQGGIVYGVAFDEKFRVVHRKVETFEETAFLRGSKYVQSEQRDIYQDIKKNIECGKVVLYTGTPCQVEGLKNYLKRDYNNLITVDIFCHGVGSPKYWEKYIQYMENKYKSPIAKVNFREKTFGYNSACMAVYFKNDKSSHKDHDNDLYWTAFSKCYIFRPSCYACKFKKVNHNSDFTIGDYWGAADLGERYRRADGCTLLLVQSEKGKKILSDIDSEISLKKIDLFEALIVNGGHMTSKLISSSPLPPARNQFMADIDKKSVEDLIKSYIPISYKHKLKMAAKPLLYKTKILTLLKRS